MMRFLTLLLLISGLAFGQLGILTGVVTDKITQEPIIGATVQVVGTYSGGVTDADGRFTIKDLKPGDYTIRVSYYEYAVLEITGVHISEGTTTEQSVALSELETIGDVVEIIGEKNIINLENGSSQVNIGADDIKEMNLPDVKSILTTQVGINQTPDGISIRGGRVYETTYLVDGVSARDPLSGTGFGVDVGSNSIQEIDLVTGGGDAEFGAGTAGIINTRIKEGGDKYHVVGSWYRDNFGVNKNQGMHWNTDQLNLALSGPVPFLKKKLTFFISGNMSLSDEYFNITANQLHSSLLEANDSFWAPRQENRWNNTTKLTYTFKPGTRLSISNQHSLNINQNTRSLQIIGNDAVVTPGFQYVYSLDMDNATTYTHRSNLTIINFRTLLGKKWTTDLTLGRLFTNLRADANGRPFREQTVDMIYDPSSIVTDPIGLFNPSDSVVYVYPGPGLFNNGGISTLWHDHYAGEYTLKYKFVYASENKIHLMSMGQEHKEQEYQWIDVTRPWIGAPIQVNDTLTTPSTSVGSASDVWKVQPATGGFFFQDEIRYKGIIAFVGTRLEYWAPGKFADDAVKDPSAPVVDEIRNQYQQQTFGFMGRRWKARLLPKLRVSFPVTENNVLYFNYGHSMQLPHPRFVYAGLDPVYQDRSFLSNLGNPNINPEVTVSYEVGLKSQISKDLALTVSAFYNDKFDYIVSRKVLIQDRSGRFTEKTFYINQDYARIRGLEIGLTRRVGKWFKVNVNGAYQIATGKSNTAAESKLQIRQGGFIGASEERYLAWDRPLDLKMSLFFKPDTTIRIFGVGLQGFRVFLSATWKSGMRYTPYVMTGTASNGRDIYEPVDNAPYSKLGSAWFWTDLKINRDMYLTKKVSATLSFEIRNLFNNKNAQIINGVTGTAYRNGDPLPFDVRDPNYPDPQDNGIPPFNPARYLPPRQMYWGISFQF